MRATKQQGPVVVDAADLSLLLNHKWHRDGKGYLRRSVTAAPCVREFVYLHRLILQAGEGQVVDHISRDKLDNRRCNLRIATVRANTINAAKPNKLGFRGVYRSGEAFGAKIRLVVGEAPVYLGRFRTLEAAARAYDDAARMHHGAFAVTNYPLPAMAGATS